MDIPKHSILPRCRCSQYAWRSTLLFHFWTSSASRKATQAIILPKNLISVFKNSGSILRYSKSLIVLFISNRPSWILGQACDNASNNDMMLSALEALNLESMSSVHTCIQCICHILNLVVKVSHLFNLHCIWELEGAYYTSPRLSCHNFQPNEKGMLVMMVQGIGSILHWLMRWKRMKWMMKI